MTAAVTKAATHILVQQKCGTWHWYNELHSEIYASKHVLTFKLTAQRLLRAILCYLLERHWTYSVFVLTCVVFT